MSYCHSCGSELQGTPQFCPDCGANLETARDSPDAPPDSMAQEQPGAESGQSPHGAEPNDQPEAPTTGQSPQAGGASQVDTEPTSRSSWKHLSDVSIGKKLAFAGSALIIVGAFLPWVTIEILGTTATADGLDGDGVFTLALGIIALVAVGRSDVHDWDKKTWIGVLVIGVVVALLALIYINDPWAFADEDPEDADAFADIGIGLYLTALGGIATLCGPLYDKYA